MSLRRVRRGMSPVLGRGEGSGWLLDGPVDPPGPPPRPSLTHNPSLSPVPGGGSLHSSSSSLSVYLGASPSHTVSLVSVLTSPTLVLGLLHSSTFKKLCLTVGTSFCTKT